MSIVAQCTNCGKKYKVADDAVGKQVRCQACQTTFTVAAAKAAVAAGSSVGQKRAPSAAMPSAGAAQQQALAKKLGLAPLPRNENAIFPEQPFRRSAGQADPLANHVVYDPGFSTVSVADYHATQMPKEQSMHDYMAEIEKEEGWAEKKEKSEMSPQTLYLLTGIAPLVVGLLAGIVAMVGFLDASEWVFSIGNVMTSVMMLGIYCQIISDHDDTLQVILFIVVPFYGLYYIIKNWSYMMHPFLASLLLSLSGIIGAVIMGVCMLVAGRLHIPDEEALRIVAETGQTLAQLF